MFEDDYNDEEESGLTLSERMALEDIIQSLENMITYFLQTEEYEKCAEIRDIIKVQDECTKES